MRRLVDALAAVVTRLPIDPPVSLPKLAHDTAGDPHFFDLDTLAGSRLVTLVAELTGQMEPTRPDRIRALLEQSGVVPDRLTATVLLHHVRQSATDRSTGAYATPSPRSRCTCST